MELDGVEVVFFDSSAEWLSVFGGGSGVFSSFDIVGVDEINILSFEGIGEDAVDGGVEG